MLSTREVPQTNQPMTGQMFWIALSVLVCTLLGLTLAVAGLVLVLRVLPSLPWLLLGEFLALLLGLGFLIGLTELKLFSTSLVFFWTRRAWRWLASRRGLRMIGIVLFVFLVGAGLAFPVQELATWRERYITQVAARQAAETEAEHLRDTLQKLAAMNEEVRQQVEQLEGQKAVLVSDNQALRTNLQKVLGTPVYGRP